MTLPGPIALSCPAGSGAVYEHGAHLTSWAPAGGDPVIWLSTLARFEPDTAIRGGVPIIFPWFGAGRAGDLSPAHGFARTRSWHLVESRSGVDDAVATFEFDGSNESDFPYSFRARYEVRIGSTLQLSLVVENLDEQPFSFEEALHTYLVVGDVREVVVQGLGGCSYLDQVATGGPSVELQLGDVRLTEETDRIYASTGQLRVTDAGLSRVIVIDKEESASTVVWNPWAEKARRMSDFGNQEWPTMLCVEGGNLRESAVQLDPGQSHQMCYSIRVEPLA